jgi:hypothetical protein
VSGVCSVYSARVRTFAVLVAASLLPFSSVSAARSGTRVYTDPDAYAVYSALLPQLWPWAQLDAMNLVIRVETKAHKICVLPEKTAPGSSASGTDSEASNQNSTSSALAQYNQVNRHPWILQRKLHISRSYQLIGSGELEGIARHEIGAWDLFFQHHGDSGGWIQFSAVGFSPDKKTAVVYAEYECGLQCGDGALYLLHKQGDQWTVAESPSDSCDKKRTQLQVTGF